MNAEVDRYIQKSNRWQKELNKLRTVMLDSSLTEELKWGKPCYTYNNSNIAILQGFKQFCAVLFPKGVLLKDARGMLQKPGPNTQAARRIPFGNVLEIENFEKTLKSFVRQAIEVEKAGLKIGYKDVSDYSIPKELQITFDNYPAFEKAFYRLTPGRQKAYILYFSGAKQSKTRVSRIEKCQQRILDGKGLNEP